MSHGYPLINVTRAGGWDEIERLLPIANAVLKQSFPELPPLTAKDFSSSERFQYPARSIYFRRMGADGEKFGVELERRDDGTVNPISVWNGGDIRDVEKPLVVRGLDLAKIPFTKEWKEMEKLRVLTDSGYTFKPEYSAYEVAPETWACYLPKEDKFYVEVGNNQRRRKLYGPIAGRPSDFGRRYKSDKQHQQDPVITDQTPPKRRDLGVLKKWGRRPESDKRGLLSCLLRPSARSCLAASQNEVAIHKLHGSLKFVTHYYKMACGTCGNSR